MKRFLLLLAFMALLPGCSRSSHNVKQALPVSAEAVAEQKQPLESTSSNSESQEALKPPIDCPLRKQGIDPHDLKPFADIQKYIDFLERSDRVAWQKPDAVIQELHLLGRETIADVGAGSGYFTFRLVWALPQGMVYAIDIEPEMLRHIHHKALTEGISNIQVIKSAPDDPKVPLDADLVFVCDVIHHVKDREVWLKKLSSQMKKGAKLVVIEFKEGDLPEGPPPSLKIPRDRLIDMIVESNFKLEMEKPDFLPYQTFLIFIKP
jgi:SAM-dependent methyltransferase